MAYRLLRHVTMTLDLEGFLPSPSPQFKPKPKPNLKFEFSFESDYEMYIQNQESNTRHFVGYLQGTAFYNTSAVVETMSFNDIHEAVRKATVFLLDHERDLLMEFACDSIFPAETLPEDKVLLLCFRIRIAHQHVQIVEIDYPRMVPASDSSFALLEKFEVDHRVKEEERGCCICLEELGDGGGALRMPCLHVFHGGCIEEWLRTSHYCPLCRYEMPTQSEADLGGYRGMLKDPNRRSVSIINSI